jgi:glycosyltransferase involved in cell wall biosynthesis
MRILHVNTSTKGGAGIACLRLHEALLNSGLDSKVLALTNLNSDSFVKSFRPTQKSSAKIPQTIAQRLNDKLHRLAVELWLSKPRPPDADPARVERERRKAFIASRPKGLDWFSYPDTGLDITESDEYQWADIIHLHWVADFLDWESFFLKNTKPLVWTLHDQNPFLGGQHYAERFLGINSIGEPQPRMLSSSEIDEETRVKTRKQLAVVNASDIHVVSPSSWLYNEAKKSELLGRFTHYRIPNHFPASVFKPWDKSFCRSILGIPDERMVILFVADSIEVGRKGFPFLQRAISYLDEDSTIRPLLCSVGRQTSIASSLDRIELGHVTDERLMAMIYASADVFLIPSLEDNLPNTMIESILCGTPVIGFPSGGIVDAIGEQFENGYICDEVSAISLKNALLKFLNNPLIFNRMSIASFAASRYSGYAVTSRYSDLYRSILS